MEDVLLCNCYGCEKERRCTKECMYVNRNLHSGPIKRGRACMIASYVHCGCLRDTLVQSMFIYKKENNKNQKKHWASIICIVDIVQAKIR